MVIPRDQTPAVFELTALCQSARRPSTRYIVTEAVVIIGMFTQNKGHYLQLSRDQMGTPQGAPCEVILLLHVQLMILF